MLRKGLIYFLAMLFCPVLATASDFRGIQDFQGQPLKTDQSHDFRLVVFWATWCTSCKDKLKVILPDFVKKNPAVQVLALNTDVSADRAAHYAKKESIALPLYRQESRAMEKVLGVTAVPHTAIYEKGAGGGWQLLGHRSGFEKMWIKKAMLAKNGKVADAGPGSAF